MLIVFDEDWLKEVRNRYKGRAPHDQPLLYSVATSERYREVRHQIESWVAALTPDLQAKFISKLRSREFLQAYNELAVRSLLTQLGYKTVYERSFEGRTPDWYVYGNEGVSAFLVEVFTDNITKTGQTRYVHIQDLQYRISQIPIGASVFLNVYPHIELNHQVNRRIAQQLRIWLETRPAEGAEMCYDVARNLVWRSDNGGNDESVCLHGPRFMLAKWDEGFNNLYPFGPSSGFWVDLDALRKKIQAKVGKYKSISETEGIPLVVAVAGHLWTGRDLENLTDVLLGRSAHDIASGRSARMDDGLFRNQPYLSGAIWLESAFQKAWFGESVEYETGWWPLGPSVVEVPGLEKISLDGWDIAYVPNMSAHVPLPSMRLTERKKA
ncbi:MAG TPA: hypothetical protein VF952_19635 [Chloroflexia bacterium]|jgi:hypothetical protein